MNCCATDMREKEVINLKDGCRLGSVCDVEVDTCSGRLVAIIIYGKNKAFGFGGREDDIKINWEDIEVIGDDTILVNFDCPKACKPQKHKNPIESLFRQG
ncbi:MAG: YlmC/YmxH family sporulation protein [Oscillospiraceae bacterium]